MVKTVSWLPTVSALLFASTSLFSASCTSSDSIIKGDGVAIEVNVNTKHVIDGVDDFDRKKFVTVHADLKTGDWDGNNLIKNVRKDFLDTYDVYLGRESGGLAGALKGSVYEDPSRPGYPDVEKMKASGEAARKAYAKKSEKLGLAELEHRSENMVVVNQFHPFWPDGTKTRTGWSLSQEDTKEAPFGTASGVYAGTFLKEYFGGEGEPRPKYLEIINEPDWDLIPMKRNGEAEFEMSQIAKLAKFHNSVAKQVKAICPDVKVGGFTCAFPNFEEYDFKRWEYRWKQFIDLTGDEMDFWSLHLYDFPCKVESDGVYKRLRKGSNIEATLDMLEHYSMVRLGKVTPLLVSEYSCSAHEIRFDPWTPYRDWLYVKSANSMLMTFMDHPQSIAVVLPFFTLKSEWGRKEHPSGNPYRSRLFRQQFEGEGEEGDKWVYTDFIHFYDMWADVNGKRVDITSANVDIQTNAYVDGKKLYVIANNLVPEANTLDISLMGGNGNKIVSIKKKHYHNPTGTGAGVIDTEIYTQNKSIEIGGEGLVVLEYTYQKPLKLTHTSDEVKYYAEQCNKQIKANEQNAFDFLGVEADKNSRATLRIGIAREHKHSLVPQITINGTAIETPLNYQGEEQTDRFSFYGVLEIEVDPALLTKDTKVGVTFGEDGGHVASASLRVFNTSKGI